MFKRIAEKILWASFDVYIKDNIDRAVSQKIKELENYEIHDIAKLLASSESKKIIKYNVEDCLEKESFDDYFKYYFRNTAIEYLSQEMEKFVYDEIIMKNSTQIFLSDEIKKAKEELYEKIVSKEYKDKLLEEIRSRMISKSSYVLFWDEHERY